MSQSHTALALVAFDCDGVMTRAPKGDNARYVATQLGIPLPVVMESFSPARKRLSSGEVDEAVFWDEFATCHGGRVPDDWIATYQAHYVSVVERVEGMKELVAELRNSGLRTAMVSNVIPSRAGVYAKLGIYEGFDPLVLSCQERMRKPQPEIFEHLLRLVGLEASAVAFVDDRVANVEAAARFGFHAILFTSAAELREQLGL